jgi:eukaryotic-like serine/threonine-protein kinase
VLYSAPMLGGSPRLLIRDVDSPITFSPDGKRFAYLREHHDTTNFDLFVANRDGSPYRTLFSNTLLSTDSDVPVWLPDGKTIVIPIVQTSRGSLGGLLAVDVETGKREEKEVVSSRVYYEPAWLASADGFVATSIGGTLQSFYRQLGVLSYPRGEFRALTTDTNNYYGPSASADGKSIAATQRHFVYQLTVSPTSNPDAIKPVPLMSHQQIWQWNWASNGKLLIPQAGTLLAVGTTGEQTSILPDTKGAADQAVACGNSIVFRLVSTSAGTAVNLWKTDAGGTNTMQLTSGRNERNPQCSPDGKWVYFVESLENQALKRIPIEGGTPETVISEPSDGYVLSPDGKMTAQLDVRELDHKLVLNVFEVADKKMTYRNIDQRASDPIGFSPDGKGVVYNVRQRGVDNLWMQPLDGSAYRELTHFSAERIARFKFSFDGSQIAIERGHNESDAVLLRDTPK